MTHAMSNGPEAAAHGPLINCRCGRRFTPHALAGHHGRRPECRQSPEERWLTYTVAGEPGQCWGWRGPRSSDRYAAFQLGGPQDLAHRIALSFALGRPLADGEQACHTCDNPRPHLTATEQETDRG